MRDLLVDHRPYRAQGAAPTGKWWLGLWEQHLNLWELHPVRDLPQKASQHPRFWLTCPSRGKPKMDHTQPHSHRLRSGRYSLAGQIYMVTVVTLNRRPIFADFAAARTLVQTLKTESDLKRVTTLAYVVMPDHLHWLMQLHEGAQLTRCVRDVKSVTTHKLGHTVWQRGFHDHGVRRQEDLQALARYVVANPVRAGWVARTGLYPHWDAVWV